MVTLKRKIKNYFEVFLDFSSTLGLFLPCSILLYDWEMRQLAGLHPSTSTWSRLSGEQFGQAEEACSEFTVSTDKCLHSKNITGAGSKTPTSPGLEQRLGDGPPPVRANGFFLLFQPEFLTS